MRPRSDNPTDNPVLQRFAEVLIRSPKYLLLGANLARDERLPARARGAAAAAAGYALLPLDLVPGIIPVAGQLDDLAVLLSLLRRALGGCPPGVATEQLARAGLSAERLDADLAIVGETARWLARGGARLVERAALAARGLLALGWRGLAARRAARR